MKMEEFAFKAGKRVLLEKLREDVSFEIFKKLVKSGSRVRCIITKNTKDKPRSFFDNIDKWAKEQGASGLAYFTFEKDTSRPLFPTPFFILFLGQVPSARIPIFIVLI